MQVTVQYEDGSETSFPDFLDWVGDMLDYIGDDSYADLAEQLLIHYPDIYSVEFADGTFIEGSDIGYRAGWDSEEAIDPRDGAGWW